MQILIDQLRVKQRADNLPKSHADISREKKMNDALATKFTEDNLLLLLSSRYDNEKRTIKYNRSSLINMSSHGSFVMANIEIYTFFEQNLEIAVHDISTTWSYQTRLNNVATIALHEIQKSFTKSRTRLCLA